MGERKARENEKKGRARGELLEKRGEEKPRDEERNVSATRNTKGHAGKRINYIPRRCNLTAGGTGKWK